ncbi:hypothetical protein [Glycomyces algeriensis]|uniref:Uncharacterized protein n=1 Tax=Glycomyces algeriensis TaxID=256037 RepID=A0A9W6G767_9ACTN|nr:hypothetical protein [Glycomyces algeriensis]MDA1366285.1 hypothetical protein [Glycomyces algeriensis]MDR7348946.1 hypothetical protein [Glycomyces algeriensis]GLI41650.1 hypothetical protein GALLR39Z86_15000 [Glycomyces algeriensis]
MTPEHVRDAAGLAAVFGFFAMAWFGWAQEGPPRSWVKFLAAGSILSILVAAAGGLLLWRHWSDGTVFDDATGRSFGIIVGVEFAAAGLGAALLAWRKHADAIAAWIAFVVGVHLFPVAVVLEIPAVHIPAALVTVAAIGAYPLAKAKGLKTSAVIGPLAGTVLLVTAAVSLVDALTRLGARPRSALLPSSDALID